MHRFRAASPEPLNYQPIGPLMIVLPGGAELGSFTYRGHPVSVAAPTTVTMSIATTYGDGSPLALAAVRVDPHDGTLTWKWAPVTDEFTARWPDLKNWVAACTEDLWNHLAWGTALTPELGVSVTYCRSPTQHLVEADAGPLDLVGAAA